MFQRTPGTWAQPQTQTDTAPVNEIVTQRVSGLGTHHCENKTWLLDTLSLHHLEHIHHTLSLTAINGGSYGTEHARPTDSVTGETRDTGLSCVGSDMAADLQWTTMGLLSVLRCTLYTSHCCRFEAADDLMSVRAVTTSCSGWCCWGSMAHWKSFSERLLNFPRPPPDNEVVITNTITTYSVFMRWIGLEL